MENALSMQKYQLPLFLYAAIDGKDSLTADARRMLLTDCFA